MRLNTPSTIFIVMNVTRKVSIVRATGDVGFSKGYENLRINPNTNASRKFDDGPASDTIASSRSGFLKFEVLIGTGLLHPILNSTIAITPTGSIWARGFKVNLPKYLGVLSPSFVAQVHVNTREYLMPVGLREEKKLSMMFD